ncbi:MAG: hypothetical protein MHM6MM_002110 [Cercozoa sp. M6MM]
MSSVSTIGILPFSRAENGAFLVLLWRHVRVDRARSNAYFSEFVADVPEDEDELHALASEFSRRTGGSFAKKVHKQRSDEVCMRQILEKRLRDPKYSALRMHREDVTHTIHMTPLRFVAARDIRVSQGECVWVPIADLLRLRTSTKVKTLCGSPIEISLSLRGVLQSNLDKFEPFLSNSADGMDTVDPDGDIGDDSPADNASDDTNSNSVCHREPTIVFCCQKCRCPIFLDTKLGEHQVGNGQTAFQWKRRDQWNNTTVCQSWFFEPGPNLGPFNGKMCPNALECVLNSVHSL